MEEDFSSYSWSDSLNQQISSLTIPSSPELESDRISEFLYGDQDDSMTDSSDYKNTTVASQIMHPNEMAEEFDKNAKLANNYENMQQASHFAISYNELFEKITPPLVEPRKIPRVVPDVQMDDDGLSSESSVSMSDEEEQLPVRNSRRFNNTRIEHVLDSEEEQKNKESDSEEEEDSDEEFNSESQIVTAPSSPILSVAASHASSQFHNDSFTQPTITVKDIQPNISTVGTIPSNMSNVSLNYQHSNNSPLPATLALRPTLPYSTKPVEYDKSAVFSGPHHLPEKYSIQPCVDYRKRHLIPDEIYYQHIKPSRYFVSQVNPFFEAAMGDASQFTSYNHYNPSDPVNFRHAYPLNKAEKAVPTRLDSIYSQQRQSFYGQSSTTPRLSPRGVPNRRRFQTTEYIEESDASQVDEEEDNTDKVSPKPMDIDQSSNQEIIEKAMTSVDISLHKEQIKSVTGFKTNKFEHWLNEWKQADPECCCICFSTKTANNNLLVYCDNPLCEVIVHQKCYNITKLPNQEDPWYCDRCSLVPSPSKIVATCPFCPSVKGAFCKLVHPIFGCSWAHLLCIKYAFEDLYCYNKDANNYEVLIDKASSENFKSACDLCDIAEYSSFGTKICCQMCSQRYHVTCAMKQGLCWVNDRNRVQSLCPEHIKFPAMKGSHPHLAKMWHAWASRENDIILSIFGKSIDGFIVEAWKGKLNSMKVSSSKLPHENYQRFRSAINAIKISESKAEFYRSVNKMLIEIRKKYILNLQQQSDANKSKGKEKQTKNQKVSSFSSNINEKKLKLFVSKDQSINGLESRRDSISTASTSSSISDEMGTGKPNKQTMEDLAVGTISKDTLTTDLQPNKKKRKSPSSSSSKSRKAQKKEKTGHNSKKATPNSKITENSTTSKSTLARKPEIIKPTACFVCNQLELPDEVRIKLKLPEDYEKKLELTKDKRKPGCTGANDYWDPRVLIKCRDCNNFIHCGCPDIPITRYDPNKRGEAFICVQCDNPKEDDILKYYNQPRSIKRINYKV